MKMMRPLIPTLLLLAFLAVPGLTQTAQAQDKLATVDLHKLFNGYWKTKQANVTLDSRKADLRKDLKDMADAIDKDMTEYKTLLTQADDPAISDAERARRKQAVADKSKDINDRKAGYDQYSRQGEAGLQDLVQRMNASLLTEIQTAVATKAKLNGDTLVINVATDAILYSKGDHDITADVLAALNAGAPVDTTPAAPAPAATSPIALPTGNP